MPNFFVQIDDVIQRTVNVVLAVDNFVLELDCAADFFIGGVGGNAPAVNRADGVRCVGGRGVGGVLQIFTRVLFDDGTTFLERGGNVFDFVIVAQVAVVADI